MRAMRAKRILLAVEWEDGSAHVYELAGGPTVSVEHEFAEPSWFDRFTDVPPVIRTHLHAEAQFMQIRHVPASDYFEPDPELAPPTLELNP